MSFLSEILGRKREEVRARRALLSDAVLEARVKPRNGAGLAAALSFSDGPMRVIAEVKRASPSLGTIDATIDAAALAIRYQADGATAISVLTDGPGFGGSLEDLAQVRSAVRLPLLRKDFIVDRYQLLEARVAGADAVLLIVAALTAPQLKALRAEALALDLDCLIEVHDLRELEVALETGAKLIGINNRNLETFEVSLAVSERLLPLVPADVRAVAESGVRGIEEARRLRAAGARNLLVGEALVRDPRLLERLLR